MKAAVTLVERYFLPHAVAAFAEMSVDPEVAAAEDAAQAAVDYMVARGLQEVSVRDAHDNLRGQSRFREAAAVARAFELAEEHGQVRRLPDPPRQRGKGGRSPSPRYALNASSPGARRTPQNPQNGASREDIADIADIAGVGPSPDGAPTPYAAVAHPKSDGMAPGDSAGNGRVADADPPGGNPLADFEMGGEL